MPVEERAHRPWLAVAVAVGTALAALAAPALAIAQDLPPAADILSRHVDAIGGREALQRLSARHTVADMSTGGIGMRIEVWQTRPDKMTSSATVPGLGDVETGYDGTHAWTLLPTGEARILTGTELETAARNARFDDLGWTSDAASMETIARSAAQDRPCWQVRIVPQAGVVSDNCFDVETGLLLETRVTTTASPGVETVISHEDYRVFDGVKTATRVSTASQGTQVLLTLVTLSHAPIPASRFDPPPEVAVLLQDR